MSNISSYIENYISGASQILSLLDRQSFENIISNLIELKSRNGRLFILGVGGSAGNASHAVNDFRKICNIETYAPTDNVSELTAWTNDSGFDKIFIEWLKTSKLSQNDAILVLSVGGGNVEKNISANIVKALEYAKSLNAMILGIVSRDGGYTKVVADACVVIPTISDSTITPYAESFQAVIWHAIVNYEGLKTNSVATPQIITVEVPKNSSETILRVKLV